MALTLRSDLILNLGTNVRRCLDEDTVGIKEIK